MSAPLASPIRDPWPDEPRISRALLLPLMGWLVLLQMGLHHGGLATLSPLVLQAQGLAETRGSGLAYFDPQLDGLMPPLAPWLVAQVIMWFGFHPGAIYLGTLLAALGTLLVVHSLIMGWHGPYRALQASLLLLASPLFYFSLMRSFALHLNLFLIMTCVWAWVRYQEENRPWLGLLHHLALAMAVLSGGVLSAVVILSARLTGPSGRRPEQVRPAAHLDATLFTLALFLVAWPALTWWIHRHDLGLSVAVFRPWFFGFDADGGPASAPWAHYLLGLLPWAPITLLARPWRRRPYPALAWLAVLSFGLIYIVLSPGSPTRMVLLTPALMLWTSSVLADEEYGHDPVRPPVLMAVLISMWALPPLLERAGWITSYRAAMPILVVGTLLVGLVQALPGFRFIPSSRWLLPLGMLLLAVFALM